MQILDLCLAGAESCCVTEGCVHQTGMGPQHRDPSLKHGLSGLLPCLWSRSVAGWQAAAGGPGKTGNWNRAECMSLRVSWTRSRDLAWREREVIKSNAHGSERSCLSYCFCFVQSVLLSFVYRPPYSFLDFPLLSGPNSCSVLPVLPFVASQFVGKWVLKYATLDLATRFVYQLHFSIPLYRVAQKERERET